MKINTNNINFSGYRNLIADSHAYDGSECHYIALQLNDVGNKDLTEWQEIKKMVPETLGKTVADDDVLTFSYMKPHYATQGFLSLNESRLFSGDDMKNFKTIASNDSDYKEKEKIMLKIYTFLASLTKRLSENSPPSRDLTLHRTLLSYVKVLCATGIEQQQAFNFVNEGLFSGVKENVVAMRLNKQIQKTMSAFFK